MDSSGRWHNEPYSQLDEINRELNQAFRPRFVIELSVGEVVTIKKEKGETVSATFVSAEKNKLTLRPTAEKHEYLETAERVSVSNAGGTTIYAQVWDNRNSLIVLRTLPAGWR